ARAVAAAIDAGDLPTARTRVRALVSRDPDVLDGDGLVRATVESVAENTSDAVVAVLAWAAVAGPAGVVAHRAVNTLDAMVGYRDGRYARFGWAAARLDDVLNAVPARLTAVLAVALAPAVGGHPRRAWRVLRRDGRVHASPNAGPVEAAFAGALEVVVGDDVVAYHGQMVARPRIGDGTTPRVADVDRAIRLSRAVGAVAAGIAAAVLAWTGQR
ncbi:MAG: adenosylcobinamide-phosphate synthase CbiB, partial [Actinomycetota bacterium]|nr:adenosylcobinamide-phosphate synthase CbiB [Actinomycetota bacterium]